jgi:hypothetical protein
MLSHSLSSASTGKRLRKPIIVTGFLNLFPVAEVENGSSHHDKEKRKT